MPTVYICPICGEKFYSKKIARDHIKEAHPEKIREVLSRVRPDKLENLRKKRNVDPENWAAGMILQQFIS
ncbi:MAG: hypothetical protein ACTSX9_08210 [Candidatus Njordarchaeales archaeon]